MKSEEEVSVAAAELEAICEVQVTVEAIDLCWSLSHCYDKVPHKSNLKRKGLFGATAQGYSPSWLRSHHSGN